MSHIEDLIEELCPNGVEYRPLGEIAEYIRGVTYKKSDEDDQGPTLILRANNIDVASSTLVLDGIKRVSSAVRVRSSQQLSPGDILICAGSESKEHIGKVAYIDTEVPYTFGGFMGAVRGFGEVLPRFIFYLLTGSLFSTYLERSLSSTTINNLNGPVMNRFRIPVPPRAVQQEIVRILDKFTALEAELEAELEARRKQYEHYRDTMLTFEDSVAKCALGDVIQNLRTGLNPRQNFKLNTRGASNRYITVRELAGFTIQATEKTDRVDDDGLALIQARSRLQADDVLFSGTGTIGRTALITEKPQDWNIKEGVYAITPNQERIVPRFLIHLLHSSSIRGQILRSADGSTVASISMASLRRIMLPVPNLEEQDRLVTLLDGFESLANDLSVGLPAELAARRKQYEYYRDRLLTFKELAA